MAVITLDGWEHGVAPSANGGGFWGTVTTPSVFSAVSSPVKNGNYALRIHAVAQPCSLIRTIPAGVRKLGIHLWFRRVDSTDFCPVIEAYDAGGNAAGLDILGFDGGAETHPFELAIQFWNGSSTVGTAYTVATVVDRWYHVELLFDTSANPWRITASIDGVQYSTSTAIAAADMTSFRIANTAPNRTFDWYMDDLILYDAADAATPFPMGQYKVLGYTVERDGTHNLDASPSAFFFKDDGTETAITTVDNSYLMLDEIPASGTDRVEIHATPTTAQYLEYVLANTPWTPLALRTISTVAKSSTGANKVSAKIRESGTDAVVFTDLSSTDSQTDYKTTVFSTKPSGGAWTQAAFNDLVYRWGYTDDATPEPWLHGVMAELAVSTQTQIAWTVA